MNQCDATHERQQQTRRRTQATKSVKSVGPLVLLLMFHGFSMAFSTLFDFGVFLFDKKSSFLTNHECVNGAILKSRSIPRNETLYPVLVVYTLLSAFCYYRKCINLLRSNGF